MNVEAKHCWVVEEVWALLDAWGGEGAQDLMYDWTNICWLRLSLSVCRKRPSDVELGPVRINLVCYLAKGYIGV